jgi:GH18 family chitinase
MAAKSSGDYQQFFDRDAVASWMYRPSTQEMLTYTDIDHDLPARVKFMRNRGLRGMMVWSVDQDGNPGEGQPSVTAGLSIAVFGPSCISLGTSSVVSNKSQLKPFPVCAPLSALCNIQAKGTSLEFTDADDLSAASNTLTPSMFYAIILIIK